MAVVTARGVVDGEPAALAGLCAARGRAVLAYCERVCGPVAALGAAIEAFATFRAAAVADPNPLAIDPEALLLAKTRHAAAACVQVAARRHAAICPEVPRLLAGAADGTLEPRDRERLRRHLARCLECRELQRNQQAAERAYRRPGAKPLSDREHAVIVAALTAAAPLGPHHASASSDGLREPAVAPVVGDVVTEQVSTPAELPEPQLQPPPPEPPVEPEIAEPPVEPEIAPEPPVEPEIAAEPLPAEPAAALAGAQGVAEDPGPAAADPHVGAVGGAPEAVDAGAPVPGPDESDTRILSPAEIATAASALMETEAELRRARRTGTRRGILRRRDRGAPTPRPAIVSDRRDRDHRYAHGGLGARILAPALVLVCAALVVLGVAGVFSSGRPHTSGPTTSSTATIITSPAVASTPAAPAVPARHRAATHRRAATPKKKATVPAAAPAPPTVAATPVQPSPSATAAPTPTQSATAPSLTAREGPAASQAPPPTATQTTGGFRAN